MAVPLPAHGGSTHFFLEFVGEFTKRNPGRIEWDHGTVNVFVVMCKTPSDDTLNELGRIERTRAVIRSAIGGLGGSFICLACQQHGEATHRQGLNSNLLRLQFFGES